MFEKLNAQRVINYYKKQEESFKKIRSNELDRITKEIKNNFDYLSYCNSVDTRANMELILNKTTTTPGALWQEYLVAAYHIFFTMLGILDYRLDDTEHNIEFYGHFSDKYRIEEYRLEKEQILTYRQKILEDYKEIKENCQLDELSFTETVLESAPCYKSFSLIFNDLSKEHYGLFLQGEMVLAYLSGYKASAHFLLKEILPIYEELISNCKNKINNGKEARELVKNLTKRI